MNTKEKVTCSFILDKDTYNAYKSIVAGNGENVKGNIVRYMQFVINYGVTNAETIYALNEVEELKSNLHKKTYTDFKELLTEIENE